MRICLALLLLVLLVGCGADDGRLAVSGSVTLDGQPLTSGSIIFTPQGAGPSAGGSIEDGAFHLDRDEGPLPGSYRVEIVSYQPTGEMIDDPDRPGERVEKLAQVLPPRYNAQSELQVEIGSATARKLDFTLQSQP